ncbi:unnamed protein product [Penicillium pancosmium]
MPIPTRSMSLREPRELRKPQTSGIARPAAKTTGSKLPARLPVANDRPQPTHSPIEGIASSRGRTLLPQRSNTGRDESHESQSAGQPSFQPPENKPGREVSPKRQQNAPDTKKTPATTATAPVPTRRQSLMRPGTSRVTPISTSSRGNVSNSTKSPLSMAPPSPRKQPTTRTPTQPAPRPASPKKTTMPPPPRPVRSASLRQPPNNTKPGVGPQVETRGHARHRSQMLPGTVRKTQTDSASTATAQKAKPQFSSYQQHYSPKKPAVKPPTPTPGTHSASEADSLLIPASWPDIAALQTELLQLSLLHSNSLQRQADWKVESETRLRKKYDAVADQYRSTLGDEKQRQTHINMQALGYWAQNCQGHHGSSDFSEQIQILSQILQEVSDLVAQGGHGRYTRAVETFEAWFYDSENIRSHRESSGIADRVVFINPLDLIWKEELQTLKAKLDLCMRQLGSLDVQAFTGVEGLEQSALVRVTQSLYESTQLMIQEIHAMRTTESEIVRAEREQVSQLATGLAKAHRGTMQPRAGLWMS